MLHNFIELNEVDYSSCPIAETDIPVIEILLNAKMGDQLKEYVLTYGYLGFSYVELYGINSRQGPKSDMIRKTQLLHSNFSKTEGLVAVEDQGDGDYYLVDSTDIVYRYIPAIDQLTCCNVKLFDYILGRFESCK